MAKKEKQTPRAKKPPEAAKKPEATGKKRPAKSVAKVPAEYVFYCHDGGMFADLEELAAGLAAMSDETFVYHCNPEKHDFANWVRDIVEDAWLADELERAASRMQAADCVLARIAILKGQ